MFSRQGRLNGLSEPIVVCSSPPKPPNRRRLLKREPITDIDMRATLSSSSSGRSRAALPAWVRGRSWPAW